MFTVVATQDIKRPPAEVFAFAGEYRNDPAWRKGVVAMSYENADSPRVGVRTSEAMRSMGREHLTIAEIVDFTPGRRTAFKAVSGPVPCDGFREFTEIPSGTRFTYSLTLRPAGFWRLLEPVLKSMFAKQAVADLERLRARLEAR